MAQAVTVREVMTADFIGVTEGEPVADVAALLREHRAGAAVVIRGGEPVGLVSATDLLGVLETDDPDEPIEHYMRAPVTTVSPEATIAHAADRLVGTEADRVVVVDIEGLAIGLLGPRDVLAATDTLLEDHLARAMSPEEGGPTRLSEQGVCESCGRLAGSLTEVDGAMLCPACAAL
ncbi:MAG: HPP family protein [Halobacteriales archaeon]